MNELKEGLANNLRIFFEKLGFDPFYVATLLMVLFALSYRKDIQNWDKLEGWRKGIVISTIYGAIIFSIISLLRLTGVIDL